MKQALKNSKKVWEYEKFIPNFEERNRIRRVRGRTVAGGGRRVARWALAACGAEFSACRAASFSGEV
ncbi:hypothetical protein [uncultured Alistipes sp.]|uniref:hypothetical protein n=1 Tax=uncultured Alistipes sp. TaxID=538949 RepID=UPI00262CE62C|nr:hypothetical protein [uncultured Alistipes sp.]